MKFARGNSSQTTLHIITPAWDTETDTPIISVLCRTNDWVATDVPIGRDDLFCGRCMDVWQALVDELPDPSTGAEAKSYPVYLQSRHWQHMRRIALEHYGDNCVLCGTASQVQVHHRTYERRGRERLADLIVLCDDCHTRFHTEAA